MKKVKYSYNSYTLRDAYVVAVGSPCSLLYVKAGGGNSFGFFVFATFAEPAWVESKSNFTNILSVEEQEKFEQLIEENLDPEPATRSEFLEWVLKYTDVNYAAEKHLVGWFEAETGKKLEQ